MSEVSSVLDAPSSKEENWRYTPVKEITSRISISRSASRKALPNITSLDIDSLASNLGGPRLVFVNGFYIKELSNVENLPGGLYCGISAASDLVPQELIDKADNVRTIAGLYDNNSEYDIALVLADKDVKFDIPIHIVHISLAEAKDGGTKLISHPRTVIDVKENSHINIVETFCGLSDNSVTDSSTIIVLGENAQLDHCRIQNENQNVSHVGHTKIEQGRGSKMNMASVTIGSDIARNAVEVQLAAPDAVLDITGVNITRRHQIHDTVVTVQHSASHCASNQRFVGVVNDHGRGSFGGEIIVEKGTVGSDAHQTNHNLVLDNNAKADTRPWLRIFADDVQCTHGATVGRLDEDSLFYLRSRGIELEHARTMLIDAFIADTTNIITNETVREAVNLLISKTTDN